MYSVNLERAQCTSRILNSLRMISVNLNITLVNTHPDVS